MLFKNYKEFIKLAISQISCIEDFALMGSKLPIGIRYFWIWAAVLFSLEGKWWINEWIRNSYLRIPLSHQIPTKQPAGRRARGRWSCPILQMTKKDLEKQCGSTRWHSWQDMELRLKLGSLGSKPAPPRPLPHRFPNSWFRRMHLLLCAGWGEAADGWQLRDETAVPALWGAQARLGAEEGRWWSKCFLVYFCISFIEV